MSKRGFSRHTLRIDPGWIVVRKGRVQFMAMRSFRDGRPRRCLPLFCSYEHARDFIGPDGWAAGVRPFRIGSAGVRIATPRVALAAVILAAALGRRCEYVAVMVGTTADGVMRWRLTDIRAKRLGGDRA
jgi:hypothetical protein